MIDGVAAACVAASGPLQPDMDCSNPNAFPPFG